MYQVNPLLAKLLAKENLTVQHGNYKTAWFDVKNRVLGLPIWKDLGKDVYDLLVGHEVGHALYTPLEGLHSSNEEIKGCPRTYINVVEDARIERKIRESYPGLIRTFKSGYKDLYASGLFGENHNFDTLKLIDKINLKSKLVELIDVPFNDEELELYYETLNTQTFSDVCVVVKKILAYQQDLDESEEKDSNNKQSLPTNEGDDGDTGHDDQEASDSDESDSDSDDTDLDNKSDAQEGESTPTEFDLTDDDEDGTLSSVSITPKTPEHNPIDEEISETDELFRLNEDKLLDVDEFGEQTLFIDDYNKSEIDQIVIPYAKLAESRAKRVDETNNRWKLLEDHYEIRAACKTYLKGVKKSVQPAVKEFEMKKAAYQWQRASSAKTGSINVDKLYSYKYEDDIFSRVTQMADAKNHGLMLLIDYSGSMYDIIGNVVQQTLHMVSFCKAVNIPFSVYCFTTGHDNVRVRDNAMHTDDIKMCELISSDLNKSDYEEAMYQLSLRCYSAGLVDTENKNIGLRVHNFNYRAYTSRYEEFGSTPLNQALLVANQLVKKFVNKHSVQKMNFVTITDGDANRVQTYRYGQESNAMPINTGTYKRAASVKLQVGNKIIDSGLGRDLTEALLDNLRKTYNANTMGFFIAERSSDFNYRCHGAVLAKTTNREWIDPMTTRKLTAKEYNKNKCVEFNNVFGYDTYYMVKGGKGALNTESDEFNPSTNKSIGNDFKKFSKSKKTNKVLMQKIGAAVA